MLIVVMLGVILLNVAAPLSDGHLKVPIASDVGNDLDRILIFICTEHSLILLIGYFNFF